MKRENSPQVAQRSQNRAHEISANVTRIGTFIGIHVNPVVRDEIAANAVDPDEKALSVPFRIAHYEARAGKRVRERVLPDDDLSRSGRTLAHARESELRQDA